jgi:hypothetical protein
MNNRRKIRSDSESDAEETQYSSSAYKRSRVEIGDEESSISTPMTTDVSTEEDNEPLLVGDDG